MHVAATAFVEKHARVCWHREAFRMAAERARQDGEEFHDGNVLDQFPKWISEIPDRPQLHFAGRIGMQECL